MDKSSKIYVAGHEGLAGSAIVGTLKNLGYENLILRAGRELDLLDPLAVTNFMTQEKPEYVFLTSYKSGGIKANITYPARFFYENLVSQTNIIHSACRIGIKKLFYLAASCIYPKGCPQPIKEEYFLTGQLEQTSQAYAIAKIAGVAMCQNYRRQYGINFISAVPATLYGPGDHFDLENSHVLAALIRKFHEAKINLKPQVVLWGSGRPAREFLYAEDFAQVCVFLMQNYNEEGLINIGSGEEISIKKLAEIIKNIVGFKGEVLWDQSKPDGVVRKVLDTSKLNVLGWRSQTNLMDGIKKTYQWYQKYAV